MEPTLIIPEAIATATAKVAGELATATAQLDFSLWSFIQKSSGFMNMSWGQVTMILVCLVLLYLALAKGFEPLLLIPIGFGGLLANIPLVDIGGTGFLHLISELGVHNTLFPIMIFIGIGAMTDFGPLIANPKTALLGAAAQFGIFGTLVGAAFLSDFIPGITLTLKECASIAIIGGADGPTAIYTAQKLAPHLVPSIAVAAYSYMALVPVIQPPIMRALTTEEDKKIKMLQLRPVSKIEKIVFPIAVTLLCGILVPESASLVGALMFGNLLKESTVTDRLSDTVQNAMMNIVTILLGLAVGSKLSAAQFLTPRTVAIVFLGLLAFSAGSAAGVLMAKIMNLPIFCKDPKKRVNPLIGSAGISAVPMAARVSNNVGLESDPNNFLLMHAMGPNVSGVIGSAVASGVLISILGG